jgi:hypothetical protein
MGFRMTRESGKFSVLMVGMIGTASKGGEGETKQQSTSARTINICIRYASMGEVSVVLAETGIF